MDNKLDQKNSVIALLILIVVGLGIYTFSKSSSQLPDTQTVGATKDYEFYKHINSYASLLPDDKLEIVNNRIEKISESMNQEDSDLSKSVVLLYASEINKDKQTEQILAELKDKVASLVQNTSVDENTIFSKNTECAKLSNNIKDELKSKYNNQISVTETEELNNIFYSPTLNACLYTTNYTYTYSGYSLGDSKYYSKYANEIYNVSSNNRLGDYPYYYSLDYPFLSKDEADKSVKKSQRDYAKFVLENSGYNAKLLEASL